MSPVFPIIEFLQPYTSAGVDQFIVTESDWLENMKELYTEENVEGFKAILLAETLWGSPSLLDQECLDILDEYSSGVIGRDTQFDQNYLAYSTTSDLFGMVVGKMYADAYVRPTTKQDVEVLITKVVSVYRTRLQSASWLGEETSSKAIEKLDILRVCVAYPGDRSLHDYLDLTFNDEGRSLLENVMTVKNGTGNR